MPSISSHTCDFSLKQLNGISQTTLSTALLTLGELLMFDAHSVCILLRLSSYQEMPSGCESFPRSTKRLLCVVAQQIMSIVVFA